MIFSDKLLDGNSKTLFFILDHQSKESWYSLSMRKSYRNRLSMFLNIKYDLNGRIKRSNGITIVFQLDSCKVMNHFPEIALR